MPTSRAKGTKGRELPGFPGFILGQFPCPVLVWQSGSDVSQGEKEARRERREEGKRWDDRVDVKRVVRDVEGKGKGGRGGSKL